MITFVFAFAGALWGGFQAKRRNGNRKDVAQYAAVYAMIFGVVGLFIAIFIERSYQ